MMFIFVQSSLLRTAFRLSQRNNISKFQPACRLRTSKLRKQSKVLSMTYRVYHRHVIRGNREPHTLRLGCRTTHAAQPAPAGSSPLQPAPARSSQLQPAPAHRGAPTGDWNFWVSSFFGSKRRRVHAHCEYFMSRIGNALPCPALRGFEPPKLCRSPAESRRLSPSGVPITAPLPRPPP